MANRQALAALLAVQVLFALWPVSAQEVFPFLPPLQLMAVRVVGAAALLFLVARARGPTQFPIAKHWQFVTLLSLLGVVANQSLFVLGLARTTPVNASLLITTIPVFTYAIAVVLGRETVGPRRALGIGLAMAGALYLVGLSRFEAGWHTAAGDLMILLNALAFSAYLVLSKPLTQQYNPLEVTMWTFVVGAVLFLPFGLLVGAPAQVAAMPGSALWWLAFILVGPSVLTYVFNAVALRHVEASTVAVFIYIQPVLTALFAWYIQGTKPGLELLPAAALVFAGVWFVARRRPQVLRGGDSVME